MVYTTLTGIFILIAVFVLYFSGRTLLKRTWFLGWLRGMAGLCLMILAVVFGFAALDIFTYKQLISEQSIANLSFNRVEPQLYDVSVVNSSGTETVHRLKGDLWQLDARIVKWQSSLAALGFDAGYRLDRLSGRYYSLEQERSEKRTVYDLSDSDSLVDIWAVLNAYGKSLGIVDATYGSATYLPMEDGALFSVTLSHTGLVARPINEVARSAVAKWQ